MTKKKFRIKPNYTDKDQMAIVSKVTELLKDLTLTVGEPENRNANRIVKADRRARSPVLSYNVVNSDNNRSNLFSPPVHDLSEIGRAVDTESLLARSVQKHRELIMKEGYEFIGKDKETIRYIKDRLRELEWVTDVSTESWVRELATNLVMYSTAFLVLKRDITKSTGSRIKRHGKLIDPIAGVFPMDPTSVLVEQNGAGRPTTWRQDIRGNVKDHDADDVIDITIDKKTGFVFGTPYSIPVLDDIRALRRLEELAELVTHKWLFPLFAYRVGTEKEPAGVAEMPDGSSIDEVDLVRAQISEMPTEGGIVMPHRHEVEIIGAEGQVLDISGYIEHFKNRVMSGLRLSGVDVGQGDTANRGTATTMSKNMVDAVKDYQCVLSDHITMDLLDVLLLEGGYDLTEDNRVYFTFPTPDREELRSHQAHGLVLFQSNAITIDEYRRDYLSLDPLTDEELQKSTFYGLFQRPDTELQAKVALAKPVGGASKSKSSGSTPVKKKAASITRPSNQFGKMPTRPAVPANDEAYLADIMDAWNTMRLSWPLNMKSGLDKSEFLISEFNQDALEIAKKYLSSNIDKGFIEGKRACGNNDISLQPQFYDIFMFKTARNDLQRVSRKLIILLKDKKLDISVVSGVFGALDTEIRHALRRHMYSAYRVGYAQACRMSGKTEIIVGDETNKTTLNIENFSIKDVAVDSFPGYVVLLKDLSNG